MSPGQLRALFIDPPRDEHGTVSYPPLVVGEPMSPKELFKYRLFLNGIRDPEQVAELWAAHVAERKKGGKP
jgi:hypothetical protein